jgi:hypothetical protein
MPTPASVFFSPLPERSIPPPHLVSLSAGQGPSDPNYPYSHQDSLKTRQETSRKHSRSQSATQVPSKAAPVVAYNSREQNDSPAMRSQSAGAQHPVYSDVPASTVQASSSSAAIPRSHAPTANRHRTSMNVSSNVPQVSPTSVVPIRSHQYHASVPYVSQNIVQTQTHHSDHGHTSVALNTDQTYAVHTSSFRPETSATHHDDIDNTVREGNLSSGYQNYTSVPSRRQTAPAVSASSQAIPSRAKHSGSQQTPATNQSTLPQTVGATASAKVIPDPGAHHQQYNVVSGYASAPDDARDRIPASSTMRHDGQSLQPQQYPGNTLDDRSAADMGYSSKRLSGGLYPPGYASSAPRESGHQTHEAKKPTKLRPSPPAVTSAISGESMSKADVPASSDRVVGRGWSTSPNVSTPPSLYLRGDGGGHGPSSTVASPGISTPSQNSPARRYSPVQQTPRRQSILVPPANDSTSRQSGITTGQQPSSRPSPKRSPSGSHLTVPVHSAHPSPSRSVNTHDVYLLGSGTPSSSSTIMQPPTPRTKSSPSQLRESLLHPSDGKGHSGVMNGGTSGNSPARSIQPHELHASPQAPLKGSLTPTTLPADMVNNTHTNDPRSQGKSRSHSHEHVSRKHSQHPTAVRSNTEPAHAVARRESNSSLQAVSGTPIPYRTVQSPQPNYRPTFHDAHNAQYPHVPQGFSSTQGMQPVEVSSSKATQQAATSGEHSSRSRKRTTSQTTMDGATVTTGNVQIDPRTSSSRSQHEPQPAPLSRHHREKHPAEVAANSTIPAADISSHLPRTTFDNVYPVLSSQSATHPRNTANAQSNVSLPYSSLPAPAVASVSYPSASRHQTGNAGRSTRPPAATPGQSRSSFEQVSSSQPTRVAVAGHLSTPASTAEQFPPSTPAQEPELLKTPSSLTSTLKKQPSYTAARPSSAQSSQESKKKGGLFSIFRSISSSAKPKETPAPAPVTHHPEQKAAKLRRSSSSKHQGDSLESMKSPGSSTTRVIALPPTVQQSHLAPVATHTQDRRVAPTKGFHPWKLLSKRHRTVSSASVEALDGTGVSFYYPFDRFLS